ncbi:MAG: ATP-binding protein [Bacteroidales bacterium]|nr:ATP-binding protein [Bacteroidales bacterium]
MRVGIAIYLIIVLHGLAIAHHDKYDVAVERVDKISEAMAIYDILQSRKGYIWLATSQGVVRYDGYDTEIYQPTGQYNKNGQISNYVRCLIEDSSGKIWVGLERDGICRFNPITKRFEKYIRDSLTSPRVRCMAFADSNKLLIGSSNKGVDVYELATGKVTMFNIGEEKKSIDIRVHAMHVDLKGRVLVGTWGSGLFVATKKSQKLKKVYAPAWADSARIQSIHNDNKGRVWVSIWSRGLYRVNFAQMRLEPFKYKGLRDSGYRHLTDFYIGKPKDKIWVASNRGIGLFRKSDGKYNNNTAWLDKPGENITLSNINVIHVDKTGLVWAGTQNNGLYKLKTLAKDFTHVLMPVELDNNLRINQNVSSILELPGNLYLIGLNKSSFYIYNSQDDKFLHKTKLPTLAGENMNGIISSCINSKGDIYLGSLFKGLYILDSDFQLLQHLDHKNSELSSKQIRALYCDKEDNVWVGHYNGFALIRYNKDSINVIQVSETGNSKVKFGTVNSILRDNKNNILIGTQWNGLFVAKYEDIVNGNFSFNRYTSESKKKSSLASNEINTLFENRDDELWIGTNQGITKYKPGNDMFTNYNVLLDKKTVVKSINEDVFGYLWLGTENGLFRFHPDDPVSIFERFGKTDGIYHSQFNRNAMEITTKGDIIAGTTNGFYVFNPSIINKKIKAYNALITGVLVNNMPIAQNRENYTFKYSENNIAFNFSLPSYASPDDNKFAYRLLGNDQEWSFVPSANRKAVYSKLLPGKYIFEVKAANERNVWNNKPTRFMFKIKQAPYRAWWAFVLYGCLLMSSLILIYRFLLWRQKLKYEGELNNAKLRFYTNISHELLTPLSIIALESEKESSNKVILRNNVRRLTLLIKQLLEFRKVESENMKLSVSKHNLVSYLEQLYQNFTPLAHHKNIDFRLEIDEKYYECYYDKDKLDKILHNLLSNAFKHTRENGSILISAIVQSNFLILEVKDNGRGIPKEKINHIFERFYMVGDNTHRGTGIGLALTKSLVHLHKGEIKVESEAGKRTTFKLKIPVHKDAFKGEDIKGYDEYESNAKLDYIEVLSNEIKPVQHGYDQHKTTLLVVEDNEELRISLLDVLKQDYNLLDASNGMEAMQVMRNEPVDVVISDVMMPEMDGFDLCDTIKHDIEISHIPVILITAKVSVENRLKGYEHGADSYIEKPVNVTLLKTRIEGLLEQRMKLQEKFKKKPGFEPTEVTITSVDEKFMIEVHEIVNSNIENAEFSVEMFAQNLNVSMSMLYRKIKNITGMTPKEFVKNYRVKRAAQLLKEKKFRISEVAALTGFNDNSYFSYCFKQHFGKSPKQFLEDYKD